MRVSYILCMKSVNAEDLPRKESGHFLLSELLFGRPLSGRNANSLREACEQLDACLKGIQKLFEGEVGAGDHEVQATLEWTALIAIPPSQQACIAKRAALLVSLHTFAEVRQHFARSERELVIDLCKRVLPIVVPPFIADQCQSPEALVTTTMLLASCWGGDVGVACGALRRKKRKRAGGVRG